GPGATCAPPRSRCCAPCPRRSLPRLGGGLGCAVPWPVVADGGRCGVCAAGGCRGGATVGPRCSPGLVVCAAGGEACAGAAPEVLGMPRAARGGLSPSRPPAFAASGCGAGTLRVGWITLLVCCPVVACRTTEVRFDRSVSARTTVAPAIFAVPVTTTG